MAINKVIYGADTLVDLTEDTVTAEDVLNSKSFHTPDGVKRTGTASYPVTDVQVNGESVMDGTVAKVEQPTADEKTATDQFTTADGGLLSKCQINLVPVQDLHGYDNPWVGGAGKNKIPMTLANIKSMNTDGTWVGNVYTRNNVIFTVNTDSDGNVTGIDLTTGSNTATGTVLFLLCGDTEFNGDYVLNGCPANGSTNTYSLRLYIGGSYGGYQDIGSGVNLSLTGSNNRFGIRIGSGASISSHIVFKPMLRLATESDPTFEPYSNICPISGHTEVDLYNVGKNKLPMTVADIKSYNTLGTWSGNVYSYGGGTLEILVDDGNVIGFKVNGTFTSTLYFYPHGTTLPSQFLNHSYILSGGDGGVRVRAYHYDGTNNAVSQNGEETSAFTFTTLSSVIDIVIPSGTTVNNVTIQPMLRLSTESDATYDPYLGHLYQVQIGSTVYGGYVDLVSGVMVVDKTFVKGNDLTWIKHGTNINNIYYSYGLQSVIKRPSDNYTIGDIVCSDYVTKAWEDIFSANQVGIVVSNTGLVGVANPNITTLADFQTAIADTDICYGLVTPQTIQLTPQQVQALVGENHLSTPLSGQSIETNGVEYKELFTFADVKEYVKPLIPYSNAGSHNAIYRGKYLGDHVTPGQWASIVAGTFDDLFIGDYWTINSVNWRIAHFDYWYRVGDTECTDHHAVIVPDSNLYNAKMNSTDITTSGYYNSEMRGGANYLVSGSSNLYSASETIKSAFGSSHILSHREILTNAVSSGNASGWAWYDSTVDLMSEIMVYGTLAWSIGGKGFEVGNGMGQLALFRHDISKATNRANWWLRSVASAARFALASSDGYVNYHSASNSRGVRPCFAIK